MGKNRPKVDDSNHAKKKARFESKAQRPLMSLASESPSENDTAALNSQIFIDVNKSEESNIAQISAPRIKANYLGELAQEKERKLTSLLFNEASSLDDYSSPENKICLTNNFIEDSTGNQQNENVEENASEEIDDQRKPAWIDDDDDDILLKDVVKATGSKEALKTNRKYQEFLQEKFLGSYGETPQWAQLKENKVDEQLSIKMTVGSYLDTSKSVGRIPKTNLKYEIVKPLNSVSLQEGKHIKAIVFEPGKSVVLVAGSSDTSYGAVTLFKFDGDNNPKIKTIQFPFFPLLAAQFCATNYQFLVGSSRFNSVIVCDIESGSKSKMKFDYIKKNILKTFEISPDGKYIAFLGSVNVVIQEAKTLSLLEKLSVPSEVNAIAFHPEAPILYLFAQNGQVYMFNTDSWQCIHSFYDDGCIEGTALAVSPNATRLACGSSSGIVNLYDLTTLRDKANPVPLKVFTSLITPITSLKFNPTSELLVIASSCLANAVKLIHISSLSVFRNFPKLEWESYKFECVAFSPDSKYLALGTDKKLALLVRLLHY